MQSQLRIKISISLFIRRQMCQQFKPKASEVLTKYLEKRKEPAWTSYFVKMKDVENDQYGMSHFNWKVGKSNYHVLRVGCFPYMKYHCSKRPWQDLDFEDKFFRFIKIANLGLPCLMYGVAATFLIKHEEILHIETSSLKIYFLMKEDEDALY